MTRLLFWSSTNFSVAFSPFVFAFWLFSLCGDLFPSGNSRDDVTVTLYSALASARADWSTHSNTWQMSPKWRSYMISMKYEDRLPRQTDIAIYAISKKYSVPSSLHRPRIKYALQKSRNVENTATYWLKIANFSHPTIILRPRSICSLWNFVLMLTMRKLESWGYPPVKTPWS